MLGKAIRIILGLAACALCTSASAADDDLKMDAVGPIQKVGPIDKVGPIEKVGPIAPVGKPDPQAKSTPEPKPKEEAKGAIDVTVPSDFVDVKIERKEDDSNDAQDQVEAILNLGGHKKTSGDSSSGDTSDRDREDSPVPVFSAAPNVMNQSYAGPEGSIIPDAPQGMKRVDVNELMSQNFMKNMPAGGSGNSAGC